jgi:hypothetical protein
VNPVLLVLYTKEQVQRTVDSLQHPRFTEVLQLDSGPGEGVGTRSGSRSSGSRPRSSGSLRVISSDEEDGGDSGTPGTAATGLPEKRRKSQSQIPLKKCKTQYRALEKVEDQWSLNMGFRNAAEVARLKETLFLNGGYTLKTVSR